MSESGPLVSTVMPVFNTERYLAASLESALRQEIPGEQEIIVVDDGSTDGSVEIVKQYHLRVQLICQENAGPAEARNRGVEAAKGEYLAFLDADDLWPEGRLALLLSVLAKEPELSMVLGHVKQFYSPELTKEEKARLKIPPELLAAYLAGGMLIRRNEFIRCGDFSSKHKLGEFIDWFNRAQEMGLSHKVVPEIVLERRIHTRNTTLRLQDRKGDYLAVVKAALDRRRRAAKPDDNREE